MEMAIKGRSFKNRCEVRGEVEGKGYSWWEMERFLEGYLLK